MLLLVGFLQHKKYPFYFLFIVTVFSCNKIETGETLSKNDLAYIKSLGLLENNESIIKFYSEYKNSVAGNFFTNYKMASYWIDERDSTKNYVSFAYYKDIASIDTNYMSSSLTYSPYMVVTKRDGSSFKVCADGNKAEIKAFFEEAITIWKSYRK
jgi:hypothetical protein